MHAIEAGEQPERATFGSLDLLTVRRAESARPCCWTLGAIAPADDPQRQLVNEVLRDPKNAELNIGGRP